MTPVLEHLCSNRATLGTATLSRSFFTEVAPLMCTSPRSCSVFADEEAFKNGCQTQAIFSVRSTLPESCDCSLPTGADGRRIACSTTNLQSAALGPSPCFPVFDTRAQGKLQRVYKEKVLPLEREHLFHQFYSPELTDADFSSAPMVLLLGQYSTGKSTFIRHLLGRDYPNLRIGPEPTTDRLIGFTSFPVLFVVP